MGGHEFSRPYQSLRCTMEAGRELVDIHRKSDSFFRFLSIPRSNADHFVLSYSPRLRSFVVHNSWPVHCHLRVLQMFMFAPLACENSRRTRRLSRSYDRCSYSPMSPKPVYRVVVRETLECRPVLDVENVLSLTLVDQNLVYMSKTNTFRSFSIFSAEFVSHHICLKNDIKIFYTIKNENREHLLMRDVCFAPGGRTQRCARHTQTSKSIPRNLQDLRTSPQNASQLDRQREANTKNSPK